MDISDLFIGREGNLTLKGQGFATSDAIFSVCLFSTIISFFVLLPINSTPRQTMND